MTPTVSVIMSVYNGGSYLKPAVESVLRQTFRDFEFLIVDDGSTDGSSEYLDRVSREDSRIRILKQENRGLVSSLNRLVQESRGRLLARMDADDICLPDRLGAQVERFENEPALGVLGGQIQLIGDKGQHLGSWPYPLTAADSEKMLYYGCPVAHPTVMMRRELVLELGGYRAFFTHSEDYDLWLRISERAPITNLDQVVLQYRLHSDSVSSVHRSIQQTGAFLAQAAWLVRRHGRPDPVDKWQAVSEQVLLSVDLPPEEKCLLLARWRFVIISSVNHKDTTTVEKHLREFPKILPAVRQQGRLIRIRLYKELTLRAWHHRDFLLCLRYGLPLLWVTVAFHVRELVRETHSGLSVS